MFCGRSLQHGRHCNKIEIFAIWFLFPSFFSSNYSHVYGLAIVFDAYSTYSGKTLRRSIITLGLMSLGLLIFQTGWEATKAVNSKNDHEINITSITLHGIQNGDIWFDALVQVLFSTNIGIGLLPVITGKFIYKGDAVRYVMTLFCSFSL